MIRTQIQLPESEYEELKRVAAEEHRSMADCVREAIHLFLLRFRAPAEELDEIAGRFRPLPLDDLKPHDRWIAEAVLASKKKPGST
jgi:hypothetical protein